MNVPLNGNIVSQKPKKGNATLSIRQKKVRFCSLPKNSSNLLSFHFLSEAREMESSLYNIFISIIKHACF